MSTICSIWVPVRSRALTDLLPDYAHSTLNIAVSYQIRNPPDLLLPRYASSRSMLIENIMTDSPRNTGPLALLSALTQLQPLLPSSWAHIIIAVHTTCNATLSLIYTSALLAWGTIVAPRRAWRSDGGTSAFGAGALVLALVSTALSFVCIPAAGKNSTVTSPQCVWIPGLVLSVILWQSYLGWWWWVGAISGGLEEVEKRKKRAKAEKGQKKGPRVVGMGTGRRGTSAAPTPTGEALTDPPESIAVQQSNPHPQHGTVLRWWVSLHRRRRAED